MKYLNITADTNDGDYISNLSEISEEELEKILPVIEAIKNFKPYTVNITEGDWSHDWTHNNNYPVGDCHRKGSGEKSAHELYGHLPGFHLFDYMVPYNEYGIHTITSIELLEVTDKKELL